MPRCPFGHRFGADYNIDGTCDEDHCRRWNHCAEEWERLFEERMRRKEARHGGREFKPRGKRFSELLDY